MSPDLDSFSVADPCCEYYCDQTTSLNTLLNRMHLSVTVNLHLNSVHPVLELFIPTESHLTTD